MERNKVPTLVILIALVLIIFFANQLRLGYLTHQEKIQQEAIEKCLKILRLNEAPKDKPGLTCRALYRQLDIAEPIPKVI